MSDFFKDTIQGLIESVEVALDEADRYASENEERYTHKEFFTRVQRMKKDLREEKNIRSIKEEAYRLNEDFTIRRRDS